MKLIVGLGNPGKKYEGTRHNVGFDTLRSLAERWFADPVRAKFDSLVAECRLRGDASSEGDAEADRALLVWPQTYMNRSGSAVRQAMQFYKASVEEVLVVCDDFHLPVGKLRIRAKGSAGGQNGLADVLQQLGGEAVPRLRIGVGPVPEGWDQAGFVLGKFGKEERELVEQSVREAADAAVLWATQGVTDAMNRFN